MQELWNQLLLYSDKFKLGGIVGLGLVGFFIMVAGARTLGGGYFKLDGKYRPKRTILFGLIMLFGAIWLYVKFFGQ